MYYVPGSGKNDDGVRWGGKIVLPNMGKWLVDEETGKKRPTDVILTGKSCAAIVAQGKDLGWALIEKAAADYERFTKERLAAKPSETAANLVAAQKKAARSKKITEVTA